MKNFSPLAIVEDIKKPSLAYPFVKTDGGREFSRRPKQKNDCSIRALAIALNRDYEEIENFLIPYGKEYNKGLANDTLKDIMGKEVFEYRFNWIPFPAIKGKKRMGPARFCNEYPKGVYIANMPAHVCAIVDGVFYDLHPQRPDRCIYGVWEVISTKNKGE